MEAAGVREELRLSPSTMELTVGESGQLSLEGILSTGGSVDLTESAVWSTSDALVATATQGVVVAISPGVVTLEALDLETGLHATAEITVQASILTSLDITPPTPQVAAGTSLQLTATGIYSDLSSADLSSTVTWTVSDPLIATLVAGSLTAVAPGSADIMATDTASGLSATVQLTVSSALLTVIELAPPAPSLPLGASESFVATGVFSDQSTQDLSSEVTWTTDDSLVATVDSTGRATALALGSTTVAATHGEKALTGETTLTVLPARLDSIEVTPGSTSVALGLAASFVATGTYTDGSVTDLTQSLTWTSSSPAVAQPSTEFGEEGSVATLQVGTATVSATDPSLGIFGSATLTVSAAALETISVSPVSSSVPMGLSESFTATGVYTDGTTDNLTAAVTWQSTAPSVATVSNASGSEGVASTAQAGSTGITATHAASGLSAAGTLEVTSASLVSLDVSPPTPSLALGNTLSFTATGTYTDGSVADLTDSVTWSSSALPVATISNANGTWGVATSAGAGTTTIGAVHVASGLQQTASLTVTAVDLVALSVTPAVASTPVGTSESFTAMGTYSDSSTIDLTTSVTWSSSSGAATISNAGGSEGVAQGIATGTSTITATDVSTGISATASLEVTGVEIVSMVVTPANSSVPMGLEVPFQLHALYSDGSTVDVTASASWVSSTPSVASVSNTYGQIGKTTTLSTGTTTITATHWSTNISGATDLTVNSTTLDSIAITPSTHYFVTGQVRQLHAVGTFSDGSHADVTTLVNWNDDSSAMYVSNNSGMEGIANSYAPATVMITAIHSLSGQSASATAFISDEIPHVGSETTSGASMSTLTMATPAAVAEGDVLIVALAGGPVSTTIVAPAGWVLVQRIESPAGAGSHFLEVHSRVASAEEPATHTFVASATGALAGGISAFAGVEASAALDVHAGAAQTASLSSVAPSVDPTVGNNLIVTVHSYASSGAWTLDGSMAEAYQTASHAPDMAEGVSLALGFEWTTSSQPTGTRTATASAHSDVGAAATLILRRR